MSSSPLSGFAISTSFVDDRVVLAVRGEIDLVTAVELAAVMDAMIDGAHRSVVLDLAELEAMDVSGVGAIAGGARRLNSLGGALTVRCPPATVRRLLDLSGLTGEIRLEAAEPECDRLNPEQSAGPSPASDHAESPAVDEPPQHLRAVAAVPAKN